MPQATFLSLFLRQKTITAPSIPLSNKNSRPTWMKVFVLPLSLPFKHVHPHGDFTWRVVQVSRVFVHKKEDPRFSGVNYLQGLLRPTSASSASSGRLTSS